MTKDEALKMALEALENTTPTGFNMERDKQFFAAITAIREALAQPKSNDNGGKTGWPPGLLQDDHSGLSRWLASKPDARQKVREALAQPEHSPNCALLKIPSKDCDCQDQQKPIAWVTGWHDGHCVIRAADPALILPIGAALYTTPPQRKPLTDEELFKLWLKVPAETEDRFAFARAIEAAHGIKE